MLAWKRSEDICALIGTLRVLVDEARCGLVDPKECFDRLRQTNFRVHPGLIKALLEEFKRQ